VRHRTILLILSCTAIVLLASSVVLTQRPSALSPEEQLGKELFFDNISQPARSMSCADCHAPETGWTGPIAGINVHGGVYRGAVPTRFGNRRPPSSAYASFAPIFHYDEEEGEFVGGVFWDGRATGERLGSPVAEQALGPFLNPVEQNMPNAKAVCEHVSRARYARLFVHVWGAGTLDCSDAGIDETYDKIGLSIAAYEGSSEKNPFSSRFDDYWRACLAAGNGEEACGLAEGNKAVLDPHHILTEQEFDGLIEFGEYCSACHISHKAGPGGTPPLFTDFRFDNIGVPRNLKNPFYKMDRVYLDDGAAINPLGDQWVDRGLGDFLRAREADGFEAPGGKDWGDLIAENDGKFRTPTVRNVDKRPGNRFPKAYMHNGVFKSLREVVDFYNTRDVPGAGWDPPEVHENVNRDIFEGKPMGNFQLDDDDLEAIVAFMKTLTDRPPAKK
jgi:cytochrome c peroxidase